MAASGQKTLEFQYNNEEQVISRKLFFGGRLKRQQHWLRDASLTKDCNTTLYRSHEYSASSSQSIDADNLHPELRSIKTLSIGHSLDCQNFSFQVDADETNTFGLDDEGRHTAIFEPLLKITRGFDPLGNFTFYHSYSDDWFYELEFINDRGRLLETSVNNSDGEGARQIFQYQCE